MAIRSVFYEFELEEGLDLTAKDDMTVYIWLCMLSEKMHEKMHVLDVFSYVAMWLELATTGLMIYAYT